MILRTLLLLALASSAHADIYRWVDEQGNVHFSDKAPAGNRADTIVVEPPQVPETPDEGELRRLQLIRDAQAADRYQADLTAASPSAEDGSARAEACYQTRAQYFWLQREAPVYRDASGAYRSAWRNETYQGERQYLADAERAAAREDIRQQLLEVCDNPYDAEEMAQAQERWLAAELCASEQVRLDALLKPESRAGRDDIENQQRRVADICR
ncbi:MAG: DUF4124 domain-containing protein [Pseudomonadales bacterium]